MKSKSTAHRFSRSVLFFIPRLIICLLLILIARCRGFSPRGGYRQVF